MRATLCHGMCHGVPHFKNHGFRPIFCGTGWHATCAEPSRKLEPAKFACYTETPSQDPPAPLLGSWKLKPLRHRTVRLPRDLYDRIDAEAASLGCTPSEVIREGIERHLDGLKLLQGSKRRHLRVTEYMQVALDAIIRKDHPEMRDTLVLETDRRMKLHHGA